MVLGNDSSKPTHRQWIHSSDSLLNGKVTYSVKFIGKAEVTEPRGMPMVKMALQKLSFSRQLKRSEGMKPPKVELGINIQSVSITDFKTKTLLHNIGLHRVSFCADDKEDKRLFAFIAKLDDKKHYCYGLDSLHQANDITLTIGQAFELAYDKFMKDNPTTTGPKKVAEMSKRIQQLESENSVLRKRIAELEAAKRDEPQNSALVETVPQSSNSSVLHSAINPVVPRSSNAALGNVTQPEAIRGLQNDLAYSVPSRNSHLPSLSLSQCNPNTSIDFNSPSDDPFSRISDSPTQTTYASMNRRAKCTTFLPPLQNEFTSKNVDSESAIGNSVQKFRNSLQRNMRKTIASEEKMKKTLSSLFPAKFLNKKNKKSKEQLIDRRRRHIYDEVSSSSCSSPRSSTYASLDEVIATLGKMMNKNESKPNESCEATESADTIGEKLATCHDSFLPNYDHVMRNAVETSKMSKLQPNSPVNRKQKNVVDSFNPHLSPSAAQLRQSELMNSNDDVSSLSTTTTDSSSAEHVYVLQPRRILPNSSALQNVLPCADRLQMRPLTDTHLKQSQGGMRKQNHMSQFNSSYKSEEPSFTSSATNLDSTFHQLGGEEGYMTLTGRKQVQNILSGITSDAFVPDHEVGVDNTYDNVSRLMEAIREAAAKDAVQKGEDVKKILTTPATVVPIMKKNTGPVSSSINHHNSTSLDVFLQKELQANDSFQRDISVSKRNLMQNTSTPNHFAEDFHPNRDGIELEIQKSRLRTESSLSNRLTSQLSETKQPRTRMMAHSKKVFNDMATANHLAEDFNHNEDRIGLEIPKSQFRTESRPSNRLISRLSETRQLQPSMLAHSNKVFADERRFHTSLETDILHCNSKRMSSPLFKRRLTSEDAFNMQPFVPASNLARLPQPPSRKPVKQQDMLWASNPFDSISRTNDPRTDMMNMQALWNLSPASSSHLSPKTKKSNYHIVSHPLIRKKSQRNNSNALKWSKKYFPGGKKKTSKASDSKTEQSLSGYDSQFNKGMLMSEENLTLDSFDPLKH